MYACVKERCENILEVGWNGCNDLNQRLSHHQAIPETETAVRWTTTRCAKFHIGTIIFPIALIFFPYDFFSKKKGSKDLIAFHCRAWCARFISTAFVLWSFIDTFLSLAFSFLVATPKTIAKTAAAWSRISALSYSHLQKAAWSEK